MIYGNVYNVNKKKYNMYVFIYYRLYIKKNVLIFIVSFIIEILFFFF